MYRARPPLSVLLYLASQEGRLVGRSADAFAVIEPPIARNAEWTRAMRILPGRIRMLSRIVRAWQFVVPCVPFMIALLVAVPVAFVSREVIVASGLILAGFALVVADMVVGLLRLAWSLARSGRAGRPDSDTAGGSLHSYHWAITFCHVTDPARADRLCVEAFERARELTDARLFPDQAFGSGLVAVQADSFTDPGVKNSLGVLPSVSQIESTGWFIIGARKGFRPHDQDAVRPLSGIRLMLVTTLLCVAATAQTVVYFERQACAASDCGGRPITFPRAVMWTLEHVIGRFPGPATWQSQVLGALVMVALPVMAVCVAATLIRRGRYQQARRRLMYKAVERMAAVPTVVILVVNDIERDAVVDAFRARLPKLVPVVERVRKHAAHRLGTLGGARIILAQSEQGTVGTGSMPWTARNLIDELDPAFLVLTGICYGLRSRELDAGTQEIGDVVVSTQLRTADHRKVTTRADGSRHEIGRGPRPESTSGLLSHAKALTLGRPAPAVHFGPVLSLNTLVNNREERERIHALDEEAIAGEMELAGLSAAAVLAKCDWILVKGISDWGVQKTDDHQAQAARHAADFVADLIAQVAPGVIGD